MEPMRNVYAYLVIFQFPWIVVGLTLLTAIGIAAFGKKTAL